MIAHPDNMSVCRAFLVLGRSGPDRLVVVPASPQVDLRLIGCVYRWQLVRSCETQLTAQDIESIRQTYQDLFRAGAAPAQDRRWLPAVDAGTWQKRREQIKPYWQAVDRDLE